MNAPLAKDWTIEQVLESYPGVADVFFRINADCVGCRLDRFCTLEEVAREYGFVLDDFLAEITKLVCETHQKEKQRRT